MDNKSNNGDFLITGSSRSKRPNNDDLKRCIARRTIEDIQMLKSLGFTLEEIRGLDE